MELTRRPIHGVTLRPRAAGAKTHSHTPRGFARQVPARRPGINRAGTLVLAMAALTWPTGPAFAALTAGRVVRTEGVVTVRQDGKEAAVSPGDTLVRGAEIKVGADAHARLLLGEKAVVDLGPGSSLILGQAREGNDASDRLRLLAGKLWARVAALGGDQRFEVETAAAVAGVRGTEFLLDVAEGGETRLLVTRGSVGARSLNGTSFSTIDAGRLAVVAGRSAAVRVETAPAGLATQLIETTRGSNRLGGGRLGGEPAGRPDASTNAMTNSARAAGRRSFRAVDRGPVRGRMFDPAVNERVNQLRATRLRVRVEPDTPIPQGAL